MCCGRDSWSVSLSEDSAGEIDGAMVYYRYRRGPFHIVTNPPHSQYVGPWIRATGKQRQESVYKYRDRIWNNLLNDLPDVDYIKLGIDPGFVDVYRFDRQGLRLGTRCTFHLDLAEPVDDLVKGWSKGQRQVVSKTSLGTENIVRLSWATFLSNYQAAHKENTGALIQWNESSSWMEDAIDAGQIICLGLQSDGCLEAGVLLLLDGTMAHYLFSYSSRTGRALDANTILLYHSFVILKNQGVSTFNFEGSMIAGVHDYFRSFGGKRVPVTFIESIKPMYSLAKMILR